MSEIFTKIKSNSVSASDAVKLIRSGDTVYMGTCSSVPYVLLEALGDRADQLENINLVGSQISQPTSVLSGKNDAFRTTSYFMGPQERNMQKVGKADFTCVHLSQVDLFFRETVPPDVVLLEVSLPDENGYMSFGASGVAINCYALEKARDVILQVNRHAPYVMGENNLIHWSQATAIVFADQNLPENPELPVDDVINTISDYLLDQIPDGACIQLGLGGVANAVGYGLKNKNDLGAHTELMGDSLMELMKLGVLNNSRKSFMKGKTVASFTFGSKALYEFVDHNEDMYYLPFPVTNDPVNIAKNDNMISINTALAIDIFGQVNADNIAGRQHSATGGQLDFVRGAQMSRGGKSFIAVTSTYQNGAASRIVSQLPLGTCVTTPRSDVQYVATEYGCVNLKHLSMRERVRAMISLAHPDFRPQLIEDAKKIGMY